MGTTIAVIGLGRMGQSIAERLLASGYTLRVYNRTASKAQSLVERGAQGCANPAEAVRGAEFVITMLADDQALRETALGERGFAAAMERGAIHLSMSTVSPEANRAVAAAQREHGSELVAAPVLGRPDAAAAGQLVLLAAGPRALEARCRPLFEALGRSYTWFGDDPGLANAAKLTFNFLLMSVVESLAEAFTLAEKQGVDRAKFFEAARLMFGSPSFDGYGKRMLAGTFQPAGFTATLALKDIGLALALAQEARAPLPLGSLIRDHLLTLLARGRDDWDMGALLQVDRESAGLS
jgi:3-hydroxyisobutyrate dehydrogenase-like beta-hydroxyacid dehydrogenase